MILQRLADNMFFALSLNIRVFMPAAIRLTRCVWCLTCCTLVLSILKKLRQNTIPVCLFVYTFKCKQTLILTIGEYRFIKSRRYIKKRKQNGCANVKICNPWSSPTNYRFYRKKKTGWISIRMKWPKPKTSVALSF